MPLDGLNEAGVACAVYTSQQGTDRNPTNQNTDKPDITTTTLIRMILDYAGSVDEAVELAQRYDMHDSSNCSYHIMVADATGKSAVLEWINDKSLKDKMGEDRKLNVLYNAESFQVITNYILAPNYYSTRREMVGFSRFNKIQQALEERHGIVKDENEAMDILKLVCRRQEKNGKSNTYTVHSVVYNLTEGLALFVGNEHYNEGREITYAIKDKSNNNLKEKPNEVMEKSQTDKPEVIGNEVNGENEMIELKEKIEAYTSVLEGYKISMAIIGEHGEDTLFYDSDTKTFSNEVPQYVYEIGSITKTFTAGLLCKEIAEGEIHLNDNLKQFYPEDLIEEHYPTVLQLATHTSGLSNDLNVATKEGEEALNKRMEGFSGDYEGDCIYSYLREEDLIENIMSIQFDKDEYPYDYSNIGYATLGNILGVAGGASYDELMNQFISEELELKETTLDMPKSSSPLKDKVLKGIGKKGSPNGNWIWGESGAKAAGAIYSTLNDMIKYVKIYMDGEKDYLKMAHDQVYAKSATNNFDLGLAWVKEGNITWHNGGTGCFRSLVGFREDKRLGAIILTNGYGKSSQTNVEQIGKSILMEEYHIE